MLVEFKMEYHEKISLSKPNLEVRSRIERRSKVQNRTSNSQSTGRRYDL